MQRIVPVKRAVQQLIHRCPKIARKRIKTATTICHCTYWGSFTVMEPLSAFTPLYAILFVLAALAHLLGDDVEGSIT